MCMQGPALYAYNNAIFTEQDWTGIRMLQDSIKEMDLTKIGRFGLGFKSVFHMTGMTQFTVWCGFFKGFVKPVTCSLKFTFLTVFFP